MVQQNPFRFGDLALDDAFTDREAELGELTADILNGQNVVIFAPRRYGKSSLVWRATQQLLSRRVLVAQVDLMTAATKEQLAAKLAHAIYEEIATPLFRARERATEIFRGLRVAPVMTVDPTDGSLGFTFRAGHAGQDVDATLEKLFQLPAELAAERKRRVCLVFDEFQEILELDPNLPALMRAVFQAQPHVAHVYLGSKRSMMERLFNDANEPFWRSAKHMELGVIAPAAFAPFIRERFETTGRRIDEDTVDGVLATTGGHPYATQELCYAVWEETPTRGRASRIEVAAGMERVLRSENAHFTLIWDQASRVQRAVLQALAQEPLVSATSEEFRRRHGLPGGSSVQRALDTLVEEELVLREAPGAYRIAEPFLAEWILRLVAA
ncbi:MAG TPA: ATP-binding protein [Gaiellaceae bacterium]|nr:ATP-binding protein [Gaiellaceae bacterium]